MQGWVICFNLFSLVSDVMAGSVTALAINGLFLRFVKLCHECSGGFRIMKRGICVGGCLPSAWPPLPPTSLLHPPLEPLPASAGIHVKGNLDKEMQVAGNLTQGHSKDSYVLSMRGGALVSEATKPTENEVGNLTTMFKYCVLVNVINVEIRGCKLSLKGTTPFRKGVVGHGNNLRII
jgi:hypothetical protein